MVGFLIITSIVILRSYNSTMNVIHKEFSTEALLKKYEYFKDLSASIDAKRANILLMSSTLSKDDKQSMTELIGVVSIHNQLCSEYNSAMSKFNYRFTNIGDSID